MIAWRKITIEMPLLAFAMLGLHAKKCSDNEFELPDLISGSICCPFCDKGRYVDVNCTKHDHKFIGVTCRRCTECAEGLQIAPCTMFSDTQCAVTDPPPFKFISVETLPPTISPELVLTHTALYATATVVFVMIIAAVMYKWFTRQSIPRDPAEEPFKIMI
ncbi:hypothetical protein AMELA_G00005760 [Ameiurus melas]|uniref:TNFR-Cys domain-containing protein n=1 Tax=Ameiurus melas TaxID=219545 RepID=A0A7J6BFA1_AMEME|nr:hypothetical protein AMELA_G00005760 [Ameiurus melas]